MMKMSAGIYRVKVEKIFKDGEQRRRTGTLCGTKGSSLLLTHFNG